MESSVVEQPGAGPHAVCGGAGAVGSDGAQEHIAYCGCAWALDEGCIEGHARHTGCFTPKDNGHDAQAFRRRSLSTLTIDDGTSVTEDEEPERADERVMQR